MSISSDQGDEISIYENNDYENNDTTTERISDDEDTSSEETSEGTSDGTSSEDEADNSSEDEFGDVYGGSDNVNSLLSLYLGGVEPIDDNDLYGDAKSPEPIIEDTEPIIEDTEFDGESIIEDHDFSPLIEISDLEPTDTSEQLSKSTISKKNSHTGHENNLHADMLKEYTAGSHSDDSDNLADALRQLLAPVSIE
jgi:hypothetical protein